MNELAHLPIDQTPPLEEKIEPKELLPEEVAQLKKDIRANAQAVSNEKSSFSKKMSQEELAAEEQKLKELREKLHAGSTEKAPEDYTAVIRTLEKTVPGTEEVAQNIEAGKNALFYLNERMDEIEEQSKGVPRAERQELNMESDRLFSRAQSIQKQIKRLEIASITPVAAEPAKEKPIEKTSGNEDTEQISVIGKRLAESVEELSSSISRNKFPQVSFDASQLTPQGLEALTTSIGRISLPEDLNDRLELEPHNFRALIDSLEKVGVNLSRLKGASPELADNANTALTRTRTKIEGLQTALAALQRYRER